MCRCLICGSTKIFGYNLPFGPTTANFCYKCYSGLIHKKCPDCGECLADIITSREEARSAARAAQ